MKRNLDREISRRFFFPTGVVRSLVEDGVVSLVSVVIVVPTGVVVVVVVWAPRSELDFRQSPSLVVFRPVRRESSCSFSFSVPVKPEVSLSADFGDAVLPENGARRRNAEPRGGRFQPEV